MAETQPWGWLPLAGLGTVVMAVTTAAMNWVFSQNAITITQDGRLAAIEQQLGRIANEGQLIRAERQVIVFRFNDQFYELNARIAKLEGEHSKPRDSHDHQPP
jgi:hypothetical protein